LNLTSWFVNLVLPQGSKDGPEFKKLVEWLMLLRLVVTTFLLGATVFFQLRESGSLFVDTAVPLYILIGTIFLLSLIYALSIDIIPDLWAFSFVQVMVDVVYATVLIHFTGGAPSVFSLLYMFPIIASGTLHFRRGAFVTAFAASVLFSLLIILYFYGLIPASHWPWAMTWDQYTGGYVSWVIVVHVTIFFFVAFLAGSLSEQLRTTKISLNLRELDYWRLANLHTSIVRSIPSGIITTDDKDAITFVNSAGAALLGAATSDLLGAPVHSVLSLIDESLETTIVGGGRTYVTPKGINGHQRYFELTVSHLKGRDETPRGRLVIFQDVTEIKKMEERVRLSEKQASFVRIAAGMAHEIRNPLASLRGAAELLVQDSEGVLDQRRLLSIVIRESDRLNSLLSDFLVMVSSRQHRKMRVILSDLVEETVALFSEDPRVGSKVSISSLINKGVEVEGEPSRLRQVLWNILSNAADASPAGSTIRVGLAADVSIDRAVLSVQDSGPGIPSEMKDRMYEPFTSTKENGTGLGLSLALSIVEAHNGTIEAKNLPGSGAVFLVKIPLAPREEFSDAGRWVNG